MPISVTLRTFRQEVADRNNCRNTEHLQPAERAAEVDNIESIVASAITNIHEHISSNSLLRFLMKPTSTITTTI